MDSLRSMAVFAGRRSYKTAQEDEAALDEINRALAAWTERRGFEYRIEALSASDFSEAARSLSEAFLAPTRLKFAKGVAKRLIELRDLYSLHSTSRKSEAFAILGVWDDDRKKLLASVQVNKERDPVILKQLPEGTESYVYGSRLAVSPEREAREWVPCCSGPENARCLCGERTWGCYPSTFKIKEPWTSIPRSDTKYSDRILVHPRKKGNIDRPISV